MVPVLTTTRLRLRPRTLDDVEACLAMDLDPEVHRYLWREAPLAEQHRERIRQSTERDGSKPGGMWIVEWRDMAHFLGWCGLFPLEDSGRIELGYRYRRQAWGQGIATEAAHAVLAHGFGALGIDPIVAVTHPDNASSRRVLEKIGFKREGTAVHYGTAVDYFRLARTDYDNSRSGSAAGPSRT